MPQFLEDRLKAEAAKKGLSGRHADAYVFGTMNHIGAMHGNRETAKGRAMDAMHARDRGTGRTTTRKKSPLEQAMAILAQPRRR